MMKLNAVVDGRGVAGPTEARVPESFVCRIAVLAIAVIALWAGPGLALDGIDLGEPLAPPAEGECPRLIQIKYPFLSCAKGQIGLADGNATWANSRQMPLQDEFLEGDGYWGPELNRE